MPSSEPQGTTFHHAAPQAERAHVATEQYRGTGGGRSVPHRWDESVHSLDRVLSSIICRRRSGAHRDYIDHGAVDDCATGVTAEGWLGNRQMGPLGDMVPK